MLRLLIKFTFLFAFFFILFTYHFLYFFVSSHLIHISWFINTIIIHYRNDANFRIKNCQSFYSHKTSPISTFFFFLSKGKLLPPFFLVSSNFHLNLFKTKTAILLGYIWAYDNNRLYTQFSQPGTNRDRFTASVWPQIFETSPRPIIIIASSEEITKICCWGFKLPLGWTISELPAFRSLFVVFIRKTKKRIGVFPLTRILFTRIFKTYACRLVSSFNIWKDKTKQNKIKAFFI